MFILKKTSNWSRGRTKLGWTVLFIYLFFVLTVVAFLQDVRRRNVHDLLQDKGEGLLRSRRNGVTVGLKRRCHRGFARHCSLPSSEQHRGDVPDEYRDLPPPMSNDNKNRRGSKLVSPLLLCLRQACLSISTFGCENNTTQSPCSPRPPSVLIGYS